MGCYNGLPLGLFLSLSIQTLLKLTFILFTLRVIMPKWEDLEKSLTN